MSVGLQSSGQISFEDIRNEMGSDGAQVSYATLYRGAGYTPSTATSVPVSGEISLTNFYGAQKWNYTDCNYPVVDIVSDIYPTVNDANAKAIWTEPYQNSVNSITGFPINFQCIFKNTTTSSLNANIYFQPDNFTNLIVNGNNAGAFSYTGTALVHNATLPIGANLISFSNTSNLLTNSATGNPGGLKVAVRNNTNTTTYFVSSDTTFRSDTQCIVHPGNFYSNTFLHSGTFTATASGTDPNKELQLGSSSVYGNVTGIHGQQRLQDFSTFSVGMEFKLSGTADAMWFQIGGTTRTTFENDASNGFLLVWQLLTPNNTFSRGLALYDGTVRTSFPSTAILDGNWRYLLLRYTKSTGLWEIYLGSTLVMSYTNPNNASWLTSSGNIWSMGARTGGLAGDFFVRRLTIYGK